MPDQARRRSHFPRRRRGRPRQVRSNRPPNWSPRQRRSTRLVHRPGTAAPNTGRRRTHRRWVHRRSVAPRGRTPRARLAPCGPHVRSTGRQRSTPVRRGTTRPVRARRERRPLWPSRWRRPAHPHPSIPRFRQPRQACPLPSPTGLPPKKWTLAQVSEIPNSEIRSLAPRKVDSFNSSSHCLVGRGTAWQGSARHGRAWPGAAGYGRARRGEARHAKARGRVGSAVNAVEPTRPTQHARRRTASKMSSSDGSV
jgi:hypothetical protein